jgi:hypothetical protein
MHPRPTALELIEAVREHLEREVIPNLADPRVRFQTRVSAYALSIVGRELALGPGPLREALSRLEGLGVETASPGADLEASFRAAEEALCERIRRGEADAGPFREAVLAHVRATLRARLEVASPDFRTS